MNIEFDVTPYINKTGTNTLAVQIYKWSNGSYFEDQDFWRLAGFERDVKLIARPWVSINDLSVTATLDNKYTDGIYNATVTIINSTDKVAKGYKVKTATA